MVRVRWEAGLVQLFTRYQNGEKIIHCSSFMMVTFVCVYTQSELYRPGPVAVVSHGIGVYDGCGGFETGTIATTNIS